MEKLDIFFFDHLQRITSLTLKATEEAPIGLVGMNHAPLVLRPEHMPQLKTVHLEYMILSPELRSFLVGHVSTLEDLHLRSCFAEIAYDMTENVLHWHELFDAISSAEPTKLRAFKVTQERPAPLPKSKDECQKYLPYNLKDEDEETLNAQMEQARKVLEEDGEKRVWRYATVDEKYGIVDDDEEENFLDFFKEGKDQEAFERLVSIVERNAEGREQYVDEDDLRGPRPQV